MHLLRYRHSVLVVFFDQRCYWLARVIDRTRKERSSGRRSMMLTWGPPGGATTWSSADETLAGLPGLPLEDKEGEKNQIMHCMLPLGVKMKNLKIYGSWKNKRLAISHIIQITAWNCLSSTHFVKCNMSFTHMLPTTGQPLVLMSQPVLTVGLLPVSPAGTSSRRADDWHLDSGHKESPGNCLAECLSRLGAAAPMMLTPNQ